MPPETTLEPISILLQVANKFPHTLIGVGWVVFIVVVLGVIDRFVIKKWDLLPQLKAGNMAVAIVMAAFIFGLFTLAASSTQGATVGIAERLKITKKYDRYFKRYTQQYFGDLNVNWQFFKAQCTQESMLRNNVKSHAGAMGICQFMPATARHFRIDPWNPKQAIQAEVRYMRQLYNTFSRRSAREHLDTMAFATSSYNYGIGNIVRKVQLCARQRFGNDLTWAHIKPCLPKETRQYWPRILRFYASFIGAWQV